MREKVCFYSNSDMSIGYNLEIAEKCIDRFEHGDIPTDLNGIIELYHIKQLFDNDCRLIKWSDLEFNRLKDITVGFNAIIVNHFNSIKPSDIVELYSELDWDYHQSFWEIIDCFKLYKLISPTSIKDIALSNRNNIRSILQAKGVVKKYASIIRDVLINDSLSAHFIVEKYVEKQERISAKEIHFPTTLTLEDKEAIILNYLDSDDPNLNYVRLLTQVKNTQQFKLSAKTKLKAKRLEKVLNDDLLNSDRASIVSTQEQYCLSDEEDISPVDVSITSDGHLKFVYSLRFIMSCNNAFRVTNCISIFNWMNKHFLVELINKRDEIESLEFAFMDMGRNSYPTFTLFKRKNLRASYQSLLYSKALEACNSSFEEELKQFYEQQFRKWYDYPGLTINLPLSGDTYLNKCRILFPELDAIVKQYQTFVQEDEIDPELIQYAPPLKMTDGRSILENKYYEANEANEDIWKVMNLLFSSQTLLAYVEPFKEKRYSSLIELLEAELVPYKNYKEHQKPKVDYLISLGIISIDAENVLILNKAKVEVLKSLWSYGVCSYWHYEKAEREVLDDMLAKGWVQTDDHLLSKPEREYFSYYLDDSLFTNGYAYRNHYAHGSTPPVNDEDEHAKAYQVFLRLLTILLLKIGDDLALARRAFIQGLSGYIA